MRSVGLRVRASLFPSEEQTPQREILPFAALEKATTTSTREKPQVSEILKDIARNLGQNGGRACALSR